MKKFTIKLLIYIFPLLLVIGLYLYKDPIKVIHHYDPFFAPVDSNYFDYNDSYISTESLMSNYGRYNYDSYIFGSSRSGNFKVDEWAKYIGSQRCFHFIGFRESLYGIEKKMQFINKRKFAFKNALLVFDHELLSGISNGQGHLLIEHPSVSGESAFHFQTEFISAFFDMQFLPAYIDLTFSGKIKPYMVSDGIFNKEVFPYNAAANEWLHMDVERKIESDSIGYYEERKNIFYERGSQLRLSPPVIGSKQIALLKNIKHILAENNTNYRIVINPLYDQLKLNPSDLAALKSIFGENLVFDFSGINEYTNNVHNYYEVSHFRIRVCTSILSKIY